MGEANLVLTSLLVKDIEDRKDIIQLVDTFYAKVLKNDAINYFFTDIAKLDFEKHMPRMYDFWESTLLHTASYAGNTLKVHKDLNEKSSLEKKHFDTWMGLFKETVDELYQGKTAELAKQRAQSIAMIIQLKMRDNQDGII